MADHADAAASSSSNLQGGGPSSCVSELDLAARKKAMHQVGQEVEMVGSSQPPQPEGSSQDSQPQQQVAKIPKVREDLRSAAGGAFFQPQTMPIGPYHQRGGSNSSFSSAEEKKKQAVSYLRKKFRVDIAGLKQLLDGLGPHARRCYTDLPDDQYKNPEEFNEMLLRDGCYLLKFFIQFNQIKTKPKRIAFYKRSIVERSKKTVRDILFLLENQIPLFLLDRMLRCIVETEEPVRPIAESIKGLLEKKLYMISSDEPGDLQQLAISTNELQSPPELTMSGSLLHLVHSCFRRPPSEVEWLRAKWRWASEAGLPLTCRWRRATDYRRSAGLQFKRRLLGTGDCRTILDMDLQGGTLHIPLLRVDESSTWTMLRNLMALEEQEESRPVTAYCYFMSQVARTAEDVDLLKRAKVLEHFLSSDKEAAESFARLCDGVDLDMGHPVRNYLMPMWHQLEELCSGSLVRLPKVREQLRRAADEDLFSPQMVPIGPYHQHGGSNSSFLSVEEEKKKAVRDLQNHLAGLKELLDRLWPKVKKCYTHLPDDYPEAVFTEMLLHDGCYLLTFFIEFEREGGGGRGSGIVTQDNTIVRDILFLLENQIPLFALSRMLQHILGNEEASVMGYIAGPVVELLQHQLYISRTPRPLPSEATTPDLLHLVYSYFRRPPPQKERRPQAASIPRWRRATDYSRCADLRFTRRVFRDDISWTILDIKLQGGTLHIPLLRVGSSTMTMLRNLMALEEQEESTPVTAYCYFMSQVARTEEDVDLLKRAKVLEHSLDSDKEAAEGFAALCDGMALDIDRLELNYLKPTWHLLEERCRGRQTHKGLFCHTCCSNAVYRLGSSDFELDLEAGGHFGHGQRQPSVATIPRVIRRAAGEDLFKPQTVLIGPYYQLEEGFSPTEEKKNAVRDLENLGVDLADLKKQLKLEGLVPQVMEYYDLPDDQCKSPQAFAEILLHDGCYLLSFFVEFSKKGGPICSRSLKAGGDNKNVGDILYLLENQIPLFALNRMLHHIMGGTGKARSALSFIAEPVAELLQQQLYISKTLRPLPPESASSDLLHLVYSYFRRQPSQSERRPGAAVGRWRRATDYTKYADLRFKRRVFKADESWTILDIDLQGGTLHIPFLQVSSNTLRMLHNLMALEEQEKRSTRPVTAYCYFMSQLACRAKDVDLLKRADILEHSLGSDEQAAEGFAALCNEVDLDVDNPEQNYLKPIWQRLDKRCMSPMNNLMAFFRRNYRLVFSAALVLFACEVLQTIYTVFAYHKPPKST